jgi:general secretion pathway protein G
MIVLVIIGLMAGVVTLGVRGYLDRARQTTVKREIATIVDGLETFYAVHARYPTNEEGLAVLTQPSEKLPDPPLNGKLTDPWGKPYQYNAPGTNGPYEVICCGADGQKGGEGINADISSDTLKD